MTILFSKIEADSGRIYFRLKMKDTKVVAVF